MKRLFAVLGDRVQGSLSPRLHTAAGLACGIDLAYVPVVCADESHFSAAVAALQTLGARGANVTIPYKKTAAALCAQVTETARSIGAVNTLTFGDGREVHGDNTDGPALVRLFSAMPARALARAQVLGSGGAARAVVWALREAGAADVFVSARRGAGAVTEALGGMPGPLAAIPGVSLVVSTLPGDDDLAHRALAEWVDRSSSPYIYDAAYGGLQRSSPLVRQARAAGLVAADGLGMLVEQAALALHRWTDADLDRARSAMKRAVNLSSGDDPFDSNSGAD